MPIMACAGRPTAVGARNVAQAPAASSAVPTAAPPPPVPALCHGFPVPLGPPIPELASYFAAKPEVFAWQSFYLFHPQAKPKNFRGFAAPLRGPFPDRKFSRVFFHRVSRDAAALDRAVDGCYETAVAADGRFCPSVSYPAIELSADQIAELLAVTNAPLKSQWARACDEPYDHAFVFVDDAGTPVAEIGADLSCGQLKTRPTNERMNERGYLDSERWARLRNLIGQFEPRRDELLEKQYLRDQAAIPAGKFDHASFARYLPAYSGVDAQAHERDLSDEQRAIACAWQQVAWRYGSPRTEGGRHSFECEDGWTIVNLDMVECQRDFPRCEASMGEVETCMRHQRFDPCFQEPAARHCVALRPCLWGFRPPKAHDRDPEVDDED